MTRSRAKHKGRADSGGYFGIPHAVMRSDNWRAMPARGVKLVCDLGGQFRGKNNGDLTAAWKVMRALGWRSPTTLAAAVRDALRFGMIEKTRQGGLHVCSLYALTWRPIDECGGKLDSPPTRVASGRWKQPPESTEKQNASTDSVSTRYRFRTYDHKAA